MLAGLDRAPQRGANPMNAADAASAKMLCEPQARDASGGSIFKTKIAAYADPIEWRASALSLSFKYSKVQRLRSLTGSKSAGSAG